MRRPLALLTLVLLPVLLPADDKKDDKKQDKKAAPNTLTKEEIKDGWLLLFDGETTFGWKVKGDAKVEGGKLVLGKEGATVTCTTAFAHCELSFEASGQGACLLRTGDNEFDLLDAVSAAAYRYRREPDAWHWSYRSGDSKRSRTEKTDRDASPTNFSFFHRPGYVVSLWDVKLRPTAQAPLFNGKNLDGWKTFKGDAKRQKSKFTVTKEGWLNVKDGPGDLQTEKTYDDFVAQLECISNGKHLNSGLFFRALPGEYQQGYEAQIRNEFTDKPTQKYLVEEFDAKTNKLTGKKEVLSPAVDYGTGAIYRRVPARKHVSKDGEWFTLTVAARGRHFATWVNGVQQVDWTDNRPAAKNARQGYYAGAGGLSIQGHDPTTDLSFRNLRVAPLTVPKKKD